MSATSGRPRLIWATLATLLTLAGLVGLGTWQLERKAWKETLLARIQSRLNAEPILIDGAIALQRAGDDIEYAPVRLRGKLYPERSQLYYAAGDLGPGYHVYTPLVLPGGAAVIVNRGYIPEGEKAAALQARPDNEGIAEIVGLVRNPGVQGAFAPANDAQHNLWYWRDLNGMAEAALGAGRREVVPFFVEEVARKPGAARKPGEPMGGATRISLPNRHLEYALTWYGIAAALAGVFLVFTRGQLRQPSSPRLFKGRRRRGWGNS